MLSEGVIFAFGCIIVKLRLEKKVINSSVKLPPPINPENGNGDNSLPKETAAMQS